MKLDLKRGGRRRKHGARRGNKGRSLGKYKVPTRASKYY